MDKLARVIRKRRISDGMIVLELPAVDLIYDDNGRVVDAQPEDTSFSHTIIEMFMVEANEAVARHLTELKVPFLKLFTLRRKKIRRRPWRCSCERPA
ncbi:MAG: RNB domain-containing ribonuclease [Planctomycetes bacterium]|nr:RNB domain-containing ribonuclease [Planctomycetota bacterium]